MKRQVLVINYHAIVPDESSLARGSTTAFSVSKTSFEKQIEIISRLKIPVITLQQFVDNTFTSDFSVILTADDGNASDYSVIYPLLKSYGFSATFFLLCNEKHLNINASEIKEMIRDGFSIGSHGISHRDFNNLNTSEQWQELELSKERLEKKTGQPIPFFAFPYGNYSKEALHLAKKAGYQAALDTQMKLNSGEQFAFLIHRWNVKRRVSPEEFEKILSNRGFLNTKIKLALIKNKTKHILGRKFAEQINAFLNS